MSFQGFQLMLEVVLNAHPHWPHFSSLKSFVYFYIQWSCNKLKVGTFQYIKDLKQVISHFILLSIMWSAVRLCLWTYPTKS